MQKRVTLISLFLRLLVLAPIIQAQSAQKPVTNADVVNMVRAGLSDDIIVAAIQSASTDCDTRSDALVALKKQGVSDRVIATMLNATLQAAPPVVRPPMPSNGPPNGAVGSGGARAITQTISRPSETGALAAYHRQGESNGIPILSEGKISEYTGGVSYTDYNGRGDLTAPCRSIEAIELHRPTGATTYLEILLKPADGSPFGSVWHFTNATQDPGWARDAASRLSAHCAGLLTPLRTAVYASTLGSTPSADIPRTLNPPQDANGAPSQSQINAAISRGLQHPGQTQGLHLVEADSQFFQGLGILAAQRGQLQPGTQVSASGFQITVFTPQTWIAQQASQDVQQGKSFTLANVTADMLRPIIRVLALPSTPPPVGLSLGLGVSSVAGVGLADSSRKVRAEPILSQPFAWQRLNGLIVEFTLEDLVRIRQTDLEFFVIVTGQGNSKEFKIKRKHFDELPL